MKRELESQFSINEDVEFIPMYRDCLSFGISTDEVLEGRIVKISFTEMKVFYDILSIYYGVVFKDIDSCKVSEIRTLPLEE